MKDADRYFRYVQWSNEDESYIGYCPDLYFGGVCHGSREEEVYAELCEIVRAEVAHRLHKGETLPASAAHAVDTEPRTVGTAVK
jgi:predicted RNase H-like HicB family nuclease